MDQDSPPDTLKSSLCHLRTVYVIHRDVDFEFGHVVDVCSSPEKAQQCLEKALQERDPSTGELVYRAEELSIEEWTLDGYLIAPSPT